MDTRGINLLENRSCWVFDLDGTLTQPVHDFAYIRSELSVPDGADILEHLATLPPDDAALRHSRLHNIEHTLACNAEPAPGTLDLLSLLNSLGVRMGILTRNSREIALLTLESIRARSYFDDNHVLGRHEVPPKPNPAGILYLLKQWEADVDSAVMIGDYLFDLQAGRAAGAVTVHVGHPDCQRWPDFSDITVDSLSELTEMLHRPL